MRENFGISDAAAVPNAALASKARVLAVDDSPAQRALISAMLRKWDYDFTVVGTAEEALDLCEREPPDIVLSDWMMPGMDGIAFCRAFRALERPGYGYFTLLTSKNETNDIAKGLDAGADDFLTKPVQSAELRARLRAAERLIATQRALEIQSAHLETTVSALRTAHDAIERELRQARRIQGSLVPERSREFGDTRVSLLLRPCGHVGGDLVGMFCPGSDRLGIYGIDVSGHGISSAMVAARVAGYLSSQFPDQNIALERRFERFLALRDPQVVAQVLNDRLSADSGIEEYLTMLYATADLRTGLISFVQAGHPNPLLLPRTGSARFLGSGGLPLGLVDQVSHETLTLQLSPGDRLLVYSDGLVEACAPDGTMLGEDGLRAIVAEIGSGLTGTDFLDELFEKLMARIGTRTELEDDVSAVLLEYQCPA